MQVSKKHCRLSPENVKQHGTRVRGTPYPEC